MEGGIVGPVGPLVLLQELPEGFNLREDRARAGLFVGEYQTQRVAAFAAIVVIGRTLVVGQAVDAKVVPAPAGDPVAARAAIHDVVAVFAEKAIVALTPVDQVIAIVGKNAVVAAASVDAVVATPGKNDIVALQAKNVVCVASTFDRCHGVPLLSDDLVSDTLMVARSIRTGPPGCDNVGSGCSSAAAPDLAERKGLAVALGANPTHPGNWLSSRRFSVDPQSIGGSLAR